MQRILTHPSGPNGVTRTRSIYCIYNLLAEADVAGRPLSHAAACSHSARRPTSHGTPHCPASSVCDRRPLWYETGGVYA